MSHLTKEQEYLIMNGWEINPHRKNANGQICKIPLFKYNGDIDENMWYSIGEALDLERQDDPEGYTNFVQYGDYARNYDFED